MLDGGEKGLVISKELAGELGAGIGDWVEFNGDSANTYKILDIKRMDFRGSSDSIYMPYYAPLVGIEYNFSKMPNLANSVFLAPTIDIKNLIRLPNMSDRQILNKAGLEFNTEKLLYVPDIPGYIFLLV